MLVGLSVIYSIFYLNENFIKQFKDIQIHYTTLKLVLLREEMRNLYYTKNNLSFDMNIAVRRVTNNKNFTYIGDKTITQENKHFKEVCDQISNFWE